MGFESKLTTVLLYRSGFYVGKYISPEAKIAKNKVRCANLWLSVDNEFANGDRKYFDSIIKGIQLSY